MRKMWKRIVSILTIMSLFSGTVSVYAGATNTIKIGDRIQLHSNYNSYVSSDSKVAYVSKKGYVTGKQKGTATISLKKGNKVVSTKKIQVIPDEKKPNLEVAIDELEIKNIQCIEQEIVDEKSAVSKGQEDSSVVQDETMATDEESAQDTKEELERKYDVSITLKNNSSIKISKIIVEGMLGAKRYSFQFRNIQPKQEKQSKIVILSKDILNKSKFQKKKVKVYIGEMVYEYDEKNQKVRYEYSKKDKKPPVIYGLIEKNSYSGKTAFQTVYTNEPYDYFKYVKASDNRDTKVELTVDTSKVNFQKKGTYTITYIAKDRAGNVTKAKAKIAVRTHDKVDQMADKILKKIIKKEWSDEKKAIAIYDYIRSYMTYSVTGRKSSWEEEAMYGFVNRRGDCITHCMMSRMLLTRAGIPNLDIENIKHTGKRKHWWNMAYVNGGFYHFDTIKRLKNPRFCLVTDKQIRAYSRARTNTHLWDRKIVPKSAEKEISKIFP